MTSSILKMDPPYPIVNEGNKLLLQAGSLVIIDDSSPTKLDKNDRPVLPPSNIYPILMDSSRQQQFVGVAEIGQYVALCREGETVNIEDMIEYAKFAVEDQMGDGQANNGFFDYTLLSDLQDYGCNINRHEPDEGKVTIPLFVARDSEGKVYFQATDDSTFFFFFLLYNHSETLVKEAVAYYNKCFLTTPAVWDFTLENELDDHDDHDDKNNAEILRFLKRINQYVNED